MLLLTFIFRAWNTVLYEFKKLYPDTPYTVDHLKKRFKNVVNKDTRESDVALRAYKKSCAQTGGGKGSKAPEGTY